MIKSILRISDGKPGHDSQSMGLCNALTTLIGHDIQTIVCKPLSKKLILKILCCRILSIKIKSTESTPEISFLNPDTHHPILVIGAGHRTHLSLIALKLYFKIPAVVLMRPSLPLTWFDVCVIPRHDNPQNTDHTIISDGALNPITMTHMGQLQKNENTALILIGGISTHFIWDTQTVIQEIIRWVQSKPKHLTITLTNSRRTPDDFIPNLRLQLLKLNIDNILIFPHEETPKGWLLSQLMQSTSALITEDSVSMIYEALTAGVTIHLVALQHNEKNKIARNNRYLAKNNYVQFSNTIDCPPIQTATAVSETPSPMQFNESQRIAIQLINRFKLS